jgi:Na+-driven multidrug efflux pump
MVADASKDRPSENIFKIMDEIVRQLNRTKKMFILMIVSIIIVVPVTHIVANILVGDAFRDGGDGPPFADGRGPPGGSPIAGAIVAGVVIAWIVLGIRQWLILNKWTAKYEAYKELQRKIDEKLDFEKDEGEKKSGDD